MSEPRNPPQGDPQDSSSDRGVTSHVYQELRAEAEPVEANQVEIMREKLRKRLATLPIREGKWIDEFMKNKTKTPIVPHTLPEFLPVTPDELCEYVASNIEARTWWLRDFTPGKGVDKNPFEDPMTEHIEVGGDNSSLDIYNFGPALTPEQLQEITGVLRDVYDILGDRMFSILKRIVIHSHFETKEKFDGSYAQARAQTIVPDNLIQLNAQNIFLPKGKSMTSAKTTDSLLPDKSPLQTALIHEIGHLLQNISSWEKSLGWRRAKPGESPGGIEHHSGKVHVLRDGNYEEVPIEDVYNKEQIESSLPATEYAFLHAAEDFAESFALLVYAPEKLDPIRRDLVLSILADQSFPEQFIDWTQKDRTIKKAVDAHTIAADISKPSDLLTTKRLDPNEFQQFGWPDLGDEIVYEIDNPDQLLDFDYPEMGRVRDKYKDGIRLR